jgi:hypothetical protein
MHAGGGELAAWLPGRHLGLGGVAGGGLVHWIVRLFIWHEIWRLFRNLWRVPTFGPFIVIALILVIVGLLIWRQSRRRTAWPGRRRGDGSPGRGPRDW